MYRATCTCDSTVEGVSFPANIIEFIAIATARPLSFPDWIGGWERDTRTHDQPRAATTTELASIKKLLKFSQAG